MVLRSVIGRTLPITTTTTITGSTTLTQHFDIVEINTTGGNIIITLPTITAAFKNRGSIFFKRTDKTTNTVTFVGTSGNYEDENLQIGNDPQQESIKIYASNDNNWRRDGYGLPEQNEYYNSLSTNQIKIGTDSDDPTINITANSGITVPSATRINATTVEFEVINHAQFNTAIGKFIKTTGFTPAAYNITGVILSITDVDHFRVTSLSDPVTNATVVGTADFGSLNVAFPGKFRVVDRVNDSNGAPANNQFTKSRSRIRNWAALSNIDHSAVASDGNLIIIVDNAGVISIIQLSTGAALLPDSSDTEPDINTHIQLGAIAKQNGGVTVNTVASLVGNNSNIHNKLRSVNKIIGTINTIENPIIITPVAATIGISTNAGAAFIASDAGFIQTGGLNPNQFTTTASSPTLILTADRAGTGNIVNVSTILNVNEFESSPGIFSAKGASKASNNFIIAFGSFNAELLGQTTYSGGTRLVDASNADEPLDVPGIAIFGAKVSQISIENAATDLSLIAQAIFKDLKQFR